MLGPLPVLHKFVLVLSALAVFVGIGVLLGAMPEVALNVRLGLLVGAATGVAAAFVLVHDFHQRERQPAQRQPAQTRRRTH